MEFAYTISGGAPHYKKFLVDSAAGIIQGVPVTSDAETANADGVLAATTTAAVGFIGVSLDAATTTAAQVGSTDNGAYISLPINPDAVYRAKLCQGATADTALTIITASSASTDGLSPCVSSSEHLVWGYTGANAGVVRRTTAANTVVIAYPQNVAIGDEFLQTNTAVADATQYPTLVTLLTQVDVSTAVDENDNFTVVENYLRDKSQDGRNNSYTLLLGASHAFSQVGTLAS